MQLYYKSAEEL